MAATAKVELRGGRLVNVEDLVRFGLFILPSIVNRAANSLLPPHTDNNAAASCATRKCHFLRVQPIGELKDVS